MKKRNAVDGLEASFLNNLGLVQQSDSLEEKNIVESKNEVVQPKKISSKSEKVKQVKRINRYFQIDEDLCNMYDNYCHIYGLNKTTSGIDLILTKFKESLSEEDLDEIKKYEERKKRLQK